MHELQRGIVTNFFRDLPRLDKSTRFALVCFSTHQAGTPLDPKEHAVESPELQVVPLAPLKLTYANAKWRNDTTTAATHINRYMRIAHPPVLVGTVVRTTFHRMEKIMKNRILTTIVSTAAVAVAFAASSAYAQTSLVTRAQVRAELAQLRAAGYDQSRGEDVTYPAQLQAAQARVNASQQAAGVTDTHAGYGGAATGSSVSSVDKSRPHVENDGMKPVYFGQ